MYMQNPLTLKSNSLEPTSEASATPNCSSTDFKKSLLKLVYSPEKGPDPKKSKRGAAKKEGPSIVKYRIIKGLN